MAGRNMSHVLVALCVGLLLYPYTNAQDANDGWTNVRDAYKAIYSHYYNDGSTITDVIPVTDQASPISVTMYMSLNSLNGFDAVLGQVDISGSMSLTWTDQVVFTNATINATLSLVTTVEIDFDKAWSPSIVLVNAVDTIKNIGDTTYQLKYLPQSKTVQWEPRILVRASCTPDVTYYPFDRQVCDFTYTAWGYTSEEISLQVLTSEWDTTEVEDNGVWKIIGTKSEVYKSGGSDYVKFEITIEREPLYFIFNVVLPILLLGLLNGFVFLLPAESGERVGFCITCFLSFVVLMQTTMGFLPEIASPMSLLCVYVFLMMCCSVVINIVCVLMLRVYHAPETDKVPRWMQFVVRVVSCRILRQCPCCKNKTAHHDDVDQEPEKDKTSDVDPHGGEIDWPTVGRLLDFFFFLAFLGGQGALTFFFILPLATRY